MVDRRFLQGVAVTGVIMLALFALYNGSRVGAQQVEPPTQEPVRTVTVKGEGTVSATPNQATIRLGVRTQADSSAEALEQNNTQMEALLAALREAGIESEDIQTSDFSIWPQYHHNRDDSPTITGYEVSNSVTVTVNNLDNFGQTLDAVVQAGGNEVGGIQFGFSNPDQLLDQAREKAMAEARHKASQLAELGGVQLGAVVTVSESGTEPRPVMMREVMEEGAADAAAAAPIEKGESSVSANVQVTYELLP